MSGSTLFFLGWLALMLIMFYLFYTRGKKAVSIFPDIQTVRVKYQDFRGSGFSNKSFLTKMGGTSRGLHIFVTENELWLKSHLFFASILQQQDLLHRVPLSNINKVEQAGNKVVVEFTSNAGVPTVVTLTTKSPSDLIIALRYHIGSSPWRV